MRRPVVAGNWKMHLDARGAEALAASVAGGVPSHCEVGVAPPFPYLDRVVRAVDGSSVWVAGQDLHPQASGAFTGDVSGSMLVDVGCTHVLVGHSERRHGAEASGCSESSALVGAKLRAALGCGLRPVLCVGETLDERDAGQTDAVVAEQLTHGLVEVSAEDVAGLIVAYEPVWAIGTGRTATSAQAGEAHASIRSWLAERFSREFADQVRIQYGGSVKPGNAAELLAVDDIDGALVGGASLDADSFLAIAKSAPE